MNQKVLGYLGRALSLELSAVQLYSTQAQLVSNWGLGKAAERFRHEVQEEMQHVERIIARMIAKGVAPNASQLRPVKLGPDLLSLLKINYRFENELIELYRQAVNESRHSLDGNDRVFFQALLEEEQQHAEELSRWIGELDGQEPSEAGFSNRHRIA